MKGENIMKKLAILLIGIMLVFVSCKKKDYDQPEITQFPETNVWTVGQILDTLANGSFTFNQDSQKDAIVKGYVIADETGGNIYRTFYLRGTDGRCIAVYRKGSGDGGSESFNVKTGDYIGYKLYGSIISEYNKLPQVQVQEYDPNKLIVIYERGCDDKVQPIPTTITDITDGKHLCDLVKLSDVQFDDSELGKTYADGQSNTNRSLVSCFGEGVIVRTSGYASFAAELLPEGKGTLACIVSVYNTTWQLLIRNTTDVHLNGQRCGQGGDIMELPYIQNFSSSFGTYTTYNVSGDQTWIIDFETAKMTGKVGSDYFANEDWLLSSPINMTGDHVKVVINYLARYFSNFSSELQLMVSEDYEYGEDPTDYTWNNIAFEWENVSDWNTFLTTEVAIDEYIGKVVTLAVKYVSPAGSCGTIEIKSIKVENGVPTPPAQTIFDESFATSQGDFEIVDVNLGGLSYVWTHASDYSCMKASAYYQQAYNAESWLVSPAIDLSGYSSAKLSFEHVYRYGVNHEEEMTLWVTTNYTGDVTTTQWTQKTIPTYSSGSNWTFVNSGEIDLSSYTSGTLYFAFKYTSTTAGAATWEVKNVLITE